MKRETNPEPLKTWTILILSISLYQHTLDAVVIVSTLIPISESNFAGYVQGMKRLRRLQVHHWHWHPINQRKVQQYIFQHGLLSILACSTEQGERRFYSALFYREF